MIYESGHRGCTTLTHHRHEAPYVTIVVSGGYVEVNGAVPEVCSGGAIVVHPAGEEHADRFTSDTRCLNVEMPGDVALSGSADNWSSRQVVRNTAQSVVRAFYRDNAELPDAVDLLYRALQTPVTKGAPRPLWLRRVLDEFAWTDGVPLREAAKLAGLHETHFSRAFRRHVGITAKEYRARLRVRHASHLLLETTSSISRVALSAGLADQSHLTRLFSERLGVSPAAYRQTFAR